MRARSCSSVLLWASVLALISACDGPSVDPDAGADAGPGPVDAGGEDAAAPDATVDCECGSGEACVRGVCLATCGLDGAALEEALSAGLRPVATFCRAAAAYGVHASGDTVTVYDVTSSTDGSTTTLVLSRWALDPSASTPAPTEVATTTHDAAAEGELVFPGGYLEIDPTGARALFGFTTSATGSPGDVVVVTLADGGVTRLAAPGNFDAAWIDATRFLVNGMGLDDRAEGQGLYLGELSGTPRALHVLTNMGDYSGSVVATSAYVLAGGVVDGTFESRVHSFSRARLDTAIADEVAIDAGSDGAVSAVLDPGGAALSSTFSPLGARLVTTPYGGPLTSYAAAEADGAVTLSDPRELASGGAMTDAMSVGGGRTLLVLFDGATFSPAGLLLVEE